MFQSFFFQTFWRQGSYDCRPNVNLSNDTLPKKVEVERFSAASVWIRKSRMVRGDRPTDTLLSLGIFWQIGVLQFDVCPAGVAPTGRSLKQ
jgi:hypothetical protein